MTDTNFNEIFGNKFDQFEQELQSKSLKIKTIDKNTNELKEYDLYSLFSEYKNILENFYKSNLEKKYLTYKNFIYYFNEFLSEFKKHGVDYKFEPKSFNITFSGNVPYTDTFFYHLSRAIYSLTQDPKFSNENIFESNKDLDRQISSLLSNISELKSKTEDISTRSVLSEDSIILTSDDFARIVFSYSSYSALLGSVDTYIRSIYSGKIQEILSSPAAVSADPSSFFAKVNCPLPSWPTMDQPRSLGFFIKNRPFDYFTGNEGYKITDQFRSAKNLIYYGYLNFIYKDDVNWISESGINLINSILNNLSEDIDQNSFKLINIKIGNEYVTSVSKSGANIDKILNNLKLSKDNFLSNSFFSDKRNKPITDIISNIILEQHNLIHPVVTSICIKKIDDIKNKYIKVLNLSTEEADLIFQDIYDDYLQESALYRELSWNGYGSSREYFDNNRVIIRNISANDSIYLSRSSDLDYLELLKKSVNYDVLYNIIKEKILTSDKEINLSEIISNYLSFIIEEYSAKIKEVYGNANSTIYANLEEVISKQKIKETISKKLTRSIKDKFQKTYEYRYDDDYEDSNVIDLKAVYEKSLDLDLNFDLRVLRFSSRLDFLGGLSYKEFLESEKKKIQKTEEEINHYTTVLSDPDLVKQFGTLKVNNIIANNNLINLFSKLIIDNFKKEGQLLQTNSDQQLEVKMPEYSDEKKAEVYNLKNISFSKLSILLESLEKEGLSLPFLFSDFLNDLRFATKALNKKDSYLVFNSDTIVSLALFWIKKLSNPEDISSPESLERNLLSFLENLPLMMTIFDGNETLQKCVRSPDSQHGLYGMENNFIKQSKFSKIETFKNLSSLLRFYHNNEKVKDLSFLMSDSKNLNKLYLNNYQVFLKSFIDFNYLLKNGLNESGQYYDPYNERNLLKISELKEQIYDLKETIKNDPNFGPERAEVLLPTARLEQIVFFNLKSCNINSLDFDEAFNKMQGNFDPKNIASLNNIISTIKQIKDIKTYVVYAKPKDEMVLDNNYMFAGSNNSKFRFRTLGDVDPQHFTIGVETACCQRIGGAGEAAAIDSFINPTASVIILEASNNSGWTTISQSYFHVASKEKYFILDNIEAGKYDNNSLKSIIGFNFFEVYAILAKELLKKGFKKVLCGKGYTDVINADSSKFETTKIPKDPRHFEIEKEDFKETNEDLERYTDFQASDSYDLGRPAFKVPEVEGLVFTASISLKNDILLKISNSVLRKSTNNLNLIKLSSYLNSINLTTYSSRVLLLEK